MNNELDVIIDTSLLPADVRSNSHDGGSSRTAIPLPKNAKRTGVNVQPAHVQTAAKPSGLRMPSPSLGFFGQVWSLEFNSIKSTTRFYQTTNFL